MAFTKTDQYNAYNVATHTVSKTRQVVMLYDGAIRFSQQAKQAMEETRIEDRFNLLMKVSDILMGLQGALDFDNGGEIAPLLYDYYSSLDARVLHIQQSNDMKIMDSVIAELKQMREAWGYVDTRIHEGVSADVSAAPAPMPEAKQSQSAAPEPVAPSPLMKAPEAPAAPAIDNSVFVSA